MKSLKLANIEIRMMSKRITIMVEDEILQKLHRLQAKKIKESSSSVSLSRTINEVLRKAV